jgi:hypothetical protein
MSSATEGGATGAASIGAGEGSGTALAAALGCRGPSSCGAFAQAAAASKARQARRSRRSRPMAQA